MFCEILLLRQWDQDDSATRQPLRGCGTFNLEKAKDGPRTTKRS
jgi:hypothetical protein